MSIYNEILNNKTPIAVIGLGYVGLPIALEFAKYFKVIGYDINSERIAMMKNRIDPSKELEPVDFEGKNIEFTDLMDDIKNAQFYVVAVPTPININNQPDLTPLLSATSAVGKVLTKGDYVVFESTVYPGCTEKDCVPILESESGLKHLQDFKVGYSPERINPGDKVNTLTSVTKVVSGSDKESLEQIAKVYSKIITAGVFRASSIKVAEAAKIIENTQRDVNIALINELSIIFNKLGINTYDVLEAAGTKWNFLKFRPGLVGGHCISVDPYYLSYKARSVGYHPQIIESGRFVNDSMGGYVAKQTVKKIISQNKNVNHSRVLVMGVSFKENVSDIRNSKVVDIIKELKTYGVLVDVTDNRVSSEEFEEEYGVKLTQDIRKDYDAVIVAVGHKEFLELDEAYFKSISSDSPVLIDLRGIYKEKLSNKFAYWSL